jgi:high affinity Mn2+ porin
VVETYYDFAIGPGLNFGIGVQLISNPNYNTDRGPVAIGWLRARAAF